MDGLTGGCLELEMMARDPGARVDSVGKTKCLSMLAVVRESCGVEWERMRVEGKWSKTWREWSVGVSTGRVRNTENELEVGSGQALAARRGESSAQHRMQNGGPHPHSPKAARN